MSWDVSKKLIILGSCKENSYLEYLKQLSNGKNIQFISEFKNDYFCQNLISNSNGLIISNDNSMIVSGPFFILFLLEHQYFLLIIKIFLNIF